MGRGVLLVGYDKGKWCLITQIDTVDSRALTSKMGEAIRTRAQPLSSTGGL